MPSGKLNPEISEAFTVAPEVVYSAIVPASKLANRACALAHDEQIRSRNRNALWLTKPRDQRGIHANSAVEVGWSGSKPS
jgi:hypothetical protein